MALQYQQGLESYSRDCPSGSNSVTSTAYRATLSGADSFDLTSPLSAGTLLKKINGRTTVYVAGSFSVASATVVCEIVFYAQNGSSTGAMVTHQKFTLTADANLLRNGVRFDAPALPFDAQAENYEIRLYAAPSAGNVSLFTWVE